MKAILVFSIIAYIGVSSLPIENEELRYIEYIDDNGILRVIDLDDTTPPTTRFVPDEDIEYYLFTRRNITDPARFYKRDLQSLMAAGFDASKPVKIGIHGWNGDGTSGVNTIVGPAMLEVADINFVGTDWSKGSTGGYTQSVRNVPPAGASIADLIDWMNDLGVDYSDFHVMGHSLGGHVAGFAARLANGTVGMVTGLDPASPSWGPTSQRLNYTDASYVEIIHTNCGQLGLLDAIGHNDFYPNGGIDMPGCDGNIYCSHTRCTEYLADSMDHRGFMARMCNSTSEAVNGNCNDNLGQLHMGGLRPKPGNGQIFALETNAEKPFYQGTP